MSKKPSRPVAEANAAPPSKAAAAGARDVVLVHGVTADEKGLKVLRARDGGVEFGEVRPLVEGQPITSDVVSLRPRKDFPYVCDVVTAYSPEKKAAPATSDTARRAPFASLSRSGPAQVATRAYRDNWDQIWHRPASRADGSDLN